MSDESIVAHGAGEHTMESQSVADPGELIEQITTRKELRDRFPDYDNTVSFSPTPVNDEEVDPDACRWVNPPYEITTVDVISRLFASYDTPVVLDVETVNETVREQLSPFSVEPFDGCIVGEFEAVIEKAGVAMIRVTNAQHLLVLYSKALLIAKYEAELSDRVVHNAPDFAVRSVNRKYRDLKRDCERAVSGSGSETITVPLSVDGLSAVRIALQTNCSPLF